MQEIAYASQQCTPIWYPELYALGVSPMWAVCVLSLWADYYQPSSTGGWLPVHIVARIYLVQSLLATGKWGQVMRWLALEPKVVPGQALAYW